MKGGTIWGDVLCFFAAIIFGGGRKKSQKSGEIRHVLPGARGFFDFFLFESTRNFSLLLSTTDHPSTHRFDHQWGVFLQPCSSPLPFFPYPFFSFRFFFFFVLVVSGWQHGLLGRWCSPPSKFPNPCIPAVYGPRTIPYSFLTKVYNPRPAQGLRALIPRDPNSTRTPREAEACAAMRTPPRRTDVEFRTALACGVAE